MRTLQDFVGEDGVGEDHICLSCSLRFSQTLHHPLVLGTQALCVLLLNPAQNHHRLYVAVAYNVQPSAEANLDDAPDLKAYIKAVLKLTTRKRHGGFTVTVHSIGQ